MLKWHWIAAVVAATLPMAAASQGPATSADEQCRKVAAERIVQCVPQASVCSEAVCSYTAYCGLSGDVCARAVSFSRGIRPNSVYCDRGDPTNQSQHYSVVVDSLCKGVGNQPVPAAPAENKDGSISANDAVVAGAIIVGGLILLDRLLSGSGETRETEAGRRAEKVYRACRNVVEEGRFMVRSRPTAERRNEICACVADRATKYLVIEEQQRMGSMNGSAWGGWLGIKQPRLSRVVEPCASTVAEESDLVHLSDLGMWSSAASASASRSTTARSVSLAVFNPCSRARVVYLSTDATREPLGLYVGPNETFTTQVPTRSTGNIPMRLVYRLPTAIGEENRGPVNYVPEHPTLSVEQMRAEIARWYQAVETSLEPLDAGRYGFAVGC